MMHASTEQLLDIKDGLSTTVDQHVAECTVCQEALEQIKQDQIALSHLNEDAKVPSHVWRKVEATLDTPKEPTTTQNLSRAIYTLAAAVVFGSVLIVLTMSQKTEPDRTFYKEIIQLMAKSNALENMISMRINLESVPTTNRDLTIERLKWRLKLIDQQIESTTMNFESQELILWQDRIRALEAINHSFYGNTANPTITAGEI